jgi:uncharacterized protein (DUF1015 family)
VAQLLAASPYNVVRLILPADGEAAAARLRDWTAAGVLAADPSPALYVYEQRGEDWLQRGLIGLVAVGTDAVLPHENVMPGPVAGRRELMKATGSNLEPILLVYNGEGAVDDGEADGHGVPVGPGVASRLVDRIADGQTATACVVTDDGITHRLWAVTDPGAQAAIEADLARRTALIADGHHRYAAYGELRAEMRAAGAGPGPWDYGLAFLVDTDAYPLRLGSIHRVLPRLDPAEAVRLAAGAFTVTPVPAQHALDRLAEAGTHGTAFLLAGKDSPAFREALGASHRGVRGVVPPGDERIARPIRWRSLPSGAQFALLTEPDAGQLAAAMPAGASGRWRALDAAVLQELLLARVWSIRDNERDVLISHDAGEAVEMAAESGGTAVIGNPMPLAAVMDIAAHGEKVPRKSTSFGPKPRTGLVLRVFND